MLLLIPVSDERRATGLPWLSLALGLVVLLIAGLEAFLPALPASWQAPLSRLAWLRLYSHPDEVAELFRPWQLWSQALMQDGWWGLGLGLAAWALLAPAVERRFGSWNLLLALLVLLPIPAGVLVLGGEGNPTFGLLVPVLAVGGLAMAGEPAGRIRYLALWWLLSVIGTARIQLPAILVLLVYALAELVRRSLDPVAAGVDSLRYIPLCLLGLVLTLAVAQLLPALLPRETRDRRVPHRP